MVTSEAKRRRASAGGTLDLSEVKRLLRYRSRIVYNVGVAEDGRAEA